MTRPYFPTLFHFFTLLLIATLSGCISDDEASLSLGSSTVTYGGLALGAYSPLSFGDACRGGGKINFCTSEKMTELHMLESDNPDVVRIIEKEDLPVSLDRGQYFLFGASEGEAVITASGTFDDGSVRSDSRKIKVKAVTSFKLLQSCNQDSSGNITGLPGASVRFNLDMYADKKELGGCHPNLLTGQPGLTHSCTAYQNSFTWQAPEAYTKQPLRSELVKGDVGVLRTLTNDDIVEAYIYPPNGPEIVLSKPDSIPMYVKFNIETAKLCTDLPITIKSLTPNVCAAPDGGIQWHYDDYNYVYMSALSEGKCKVQVSLDGQTFHQPRTYSVFFYSSDLGRDGYAGFGSPCEFEGATVCSYGLSSVAICEEGKWREKRRCEDSTPICDAKPSSEKGCIEGLPCADCRGLRPN